MRISHLLSAADARRLRPNNGPFRIEKSENMSDIDIGFVKS